MKSTDQGRGSVCPVPPAETDSRPREASLAKRRAELRAKKVQRIKQEIEEGTYDVNAADVVRGIARSELSWLLRLDYECLRDVE